jgi:hypothetical protein
MNKPVPPSLPPGVGKITIWPSHRTRGASYGLDYPLCFGNIKGFGAWMVWDRETGVVEAVFPHVPNIHGWSNASLQAQRYADPGEPFDFSIYDSVA